MGKFVEDEISLSPERYGTIPAVTAAEICFEPCQSQMSAINKNLQKCLGHDWHARTDHYSKKY